MSEIHFIFFKINYKTVALFLGRYKVWHIISPRTLECYWLFFFSSLSPNCVSWRLSPEPGQCYLSASLCSRANYTLFSLLFFPLLYFNIFQASFSTWSTSLIIPHAAHWGQMECFRDWISMHEWFTGVAFPSPAQSTSAAWWRCCTTCSSSRLWLLSPPSSAQKKGRPGVRPERSRR